jgi:hypothetical protein
METNCNIYNGSRARIDNIEKLEELGYKLEDGIHLVAVFDNSSISFANPVLLEIPAQFFPQEEFCLRVGNRKANDQMMVFVEIENAKYRWTLLRFKNNKVQIDNDIDNLVIW